MTELITLDDHERQRFRAYLAQEAETNDGLAGQMEKLSGPGMAALAKRHRMVAASAKIMEKDLDRGERISIGGTDE